MTDVYGEHIGLGYVKVSQGVAGVCESLRYAQTNMKMNWHPNAQGTHFQADVFSYWFLNTTIHYLENNFNMLNNFLSNNKMLELHEMLIQDSGNWQKEILTKRVAWPQRDQNAPKLFCLPYCQSIPFTLHLWRPLTWNVGTRLADYYVLDHAMSLCEKSTGNECKMFDNKYTTNYDSLKTKYGSFWKWEYFGHWNLDTLTGWNSPKIGSGNDLMDGWLGPIDNKPVSAANIPFFVQVE